MGGVDSFFLNGIKQRICKKEEGELFFFSSRNFEHAFFISWQAHLNGASCPSAGSSLPRSSTADSL